jgi:hypothetical protein
MLTIIAGKPGSGKTYHMMSLLTDQLTDWARYENKHGQPFDSTVQTNIVINMDGINETISKRIGKEVDVSGYINYCDEKFFHDESCIYWWNKFPPKSLIVIDEVHQYLGKSFEYGSIDVETELINFLSTHRHGQQELFFLTQHIDQFASQILGIADTLLEIVNVKSLHLPFPISVPMADIDEVKRAFGIRTQYYQANVGNFRGKAVKWSGSTSRHLMSEEIYRVYKSHTKSNESSDRPSLDMSPIEALVWFARRHAWHLVPKIGGVVVSPFVIYGIMSGAPSVLSAAVVKPKVESTQKTEQKNEVSVTQEKQVEAVPSLSSSVVSPVASPSPVPGSSVPGTGIFGIGGKSEPLVTEIVALYPDGVLLSNGKKYRVGETFIFEGQEEILRCVNVVCGKVCFESGKIVTF